MGDIPDADLLLKPRLVQAAPSEKTTSRFQKEIYEPFYQNKLHFTPDRIMEMIKYMRVSSYPV